MATRESAALALLNTGRPGIAVASGAMAAGAALFGGVRSPVEVAMAGVVVFLITMLAMVTNDLVDLETDRRAGVTRALARALVSPRRATQYAVGLGAAALIIAALGTPPWALLAVSMVAGVGYSAFARIAPALKTVYAAVCCALPLVYGAQVAGAAVPLTPIVGIVLFNLGRELFLDAGDAAGDGRSGVRTAAIVLGPVRARQLGGVCMLAVALWFAWAAPLPAARGAALGTGALVALGAVASRVSVEGARRFTRAAMVVGALVAASYIAPHG